MPQNLGKELETKFFLYLNTLKLFGGIEVVHDISQFNEAEDQNRKYIYVKIKIILIIFYIYYLLSRKKVLLQ